MLDLNSLSPGSFNGASFLIESTNVQGGRKTVIHEFPNQDTRYVEDLGLLNETIQLNVTVPTADYFGNRDSIKAALEFEGYGTLIHPYYGVRNAICQSYNIDEETASFGYVRISMTLIVGQELNFPGTGGGVGSFTAIFSAVSTMLTALSNSFGTMAPIHLIDSRSLTSLTSVSAAIWAGFRAAAGNYTVRAEFSPEYQADFYRDLGKYELAPASKILTAETFLSALTSLTLKIDAITLSPSSGISVALGLSNITLPVPAFKPTATSADMTFGIYESIDVAVKIQALGILAKNIAVNEFTSTRDVSIVGIQVHELSKNIQLALDTIASYTYRHRSNPSIPQVSDLVEAVKSLEVSTLEYLNSIYTTTRNIEEVTCVKEPLTVLTYSLYGHLKDDDNIRLLNRVDESDVTSLEGEVLVFTVK